MIITKLINNLKCLTQFYQSLVTTVDRIEATLTDPFLSESVLIESNYVTSGAVGFILPEGIQIVSILLYVVGESGFDDFETIEISNVIISDQANGKNVVVQYTGDHELNNYEVKVIYYYP
jgi:hypothetical protein